MNELYPKGTEIIVIDGRGFRWAGPVLSASYDYVRLRDRKTDREIFLNMSKVVRIEVLS